MISPDQPEVVERWLRERAHLRQELEAARANAKAHAAAERRQIRHDRILLELVRGLPWEREMRDLLDVARDRAAVEP